MSPISPKVLKPNGLIEMRIPEAVRKAVYERDRYTCRDCGVAGRPGRKQGYVQVYHLIAIRDGGDHSPDNLITVCYACRRARDEEKRSQRPASRSSHRWRAKS
ncbi:MAG: HNH endonuclease [Pyrinomonadaceae bacterium]